jgi:hypothetical protein
VVPTTGKSRKEECLLFEQDVEKTCVVVTKEEAGRVRPIKEPLEFSASWQQEIRLVNRSSWRVMLQNSFWFGRKIQMRDRIFGRTLSKARSTNPYLHRVIHLCVVLLLLVAVIPATSLAQIQHQPKPIGSESAPEPAVPAILAAFDQYEVVAVPAGHGIKDLDDFILLLIRNPAFSKNINDIAVECGNSRYQPILDRYIAGEDVPFTEVRKVWRNTTQQMCGMSGFYEQFFPLVRAINQRLPPGKHLRVLACDPPIDWDQVKNYQDILKLTHRDANIASVMEKEVLSKHRKALMLFGTFHIVHGVGASAVSIYEKDYPNRTLVISDLGYFDTDLPALSSSPFVTWPIPSLAQTKDTWLGALPLDRFLPPPTLIDQDCNVHNDFPKELQKNMAQLVDALLYLGSQDLRLKDQLPADIALDVDYRMELQRRGALPGFPGAAGGTPKEILKEFDQQIVNDAGNPMFAIPKSEMPNPSDPELSRVVQSCLDRKSHRSPTQ